MNNEELIKENLLLREENEKLKKQLENYNNSRKSYYEKNKDLVNQKAKERLKKLAEENPEKLKEINKKAYKKFDTKADADNFIHSNEKNITVVKSEFIPDYYVYTDGACSNNGKKNALSGIGIFFGINDIRNISKKITGKQTNNTAELTAIIETYYIIENDIKNDKKIIIVSDSEYAIRCVSSYGEKCYKKKWNIDIPNKELVKKAYELYKDKLNVKFIHIKAHTHNTDVHSIGNENADKLANMAISL